MPKIALIQPPNTRLLALLVVLRTPSGVVPMMLPHTQQEGITVPTRLQPTSDRMSDVVLMMFSELHQQLITLSPPFMRHHFIPSLTQQLVGTPPEMEEWGSPVVPLLNHR